MARIGSSGTGGASSGGSSGVNSIPPTDINAIARWNDTTGSYIKNSPGTYIQDSGAIEAQGYITNRTVSMTVTVNAGESWIAPALTIAPGGMIILNGDAELILV
jgi:hypothetical protein